LRIAAAGIFVVAFFVCVSLLGATEPGPNGKPIIEAVGHGEAGAAADQALINLAADSRADTADEAVKANAATVSAITEAVKPYLTSAGDSIEATKLSMSPEYAAYGQQVPNKTKIYGVTRRFNIFVPSSDLALAGQVVTIATAVQGSRFVGTDNESDPGNIRVIVELSSTAATAEQAVQSIQQRSQKLEESLTAKLNGRGRIETEDTLGEESNHMASAQPESVGYSANSTVTIKLSGLATLALLPMPRLKLGRVV
jgi:uncharacterized protein YggE